MSLAATVQRIIARTGSAHTIRRVTRAAGANDWTPGSETVAYHASVGRQGGFSWSERNDLRGGIQSDDVMLVLDAATVGIEPRAGDRIAPGTFASDVGAAFVEVVNVRIPREAGTARIYRCHCRK